MILHLNRYPSPHAGVFGKLSVAYKAHEGDKVFSCVTVERPWLKNAPNISCIPDGEYILKKSFYHRGDHPAYEVQDVPGRSRILIHRANTHLDVQGCIGIGSDFGYVNGLWAITSSRIAFDAFMVEMDIIDEAALVIRWA